MLLGVLESMVKSYLRALSNRDDLINIIIAKLMAKALIKPNLGFVVDVDVHSSHWAPILFRQIRFANHGKVDIPDGARKEIEFLFHHDISRVNKLYITRTVIICLDQTTFKYVHQLLLQRRMTN